MTMIVVCSRSTVRAGSLTNRSLYHTAAMAVGVVQKLVKVSILIAAYLVTAVAAKAIAQAPPRPSPGSPSFALTAGSRIGRASFSSSRSRIL
jgi:hypothetical protein